MNGLRDKVVVITGATSGIGLATAYAFADEGAVVVAAGRQGQALENIAEACRERAGQSLAVPTDTAREEQVHALARRAVQAFGRIDVWINNAAVTAFGRFADVPSDVFRQVIETDFFGYVNGARAVMPVFREQGRGVMINIASVVSYVPQPYASAYVCSKHAVRALSECLRMELSLEKTPGIHVCTVLPGTIDTPIFQHGANYLGRAARALPPVYDPASVARAILRLAVRPQRELFVGRAARVQTLMRALAPAMFERIGARHVDRGHFQDRPAAEKPGNVFEPGSPYLQVRGGWQATPAQRTGQAVLAMAGAAVAVPALLYWMRRRQTGGTPVARRFAREGGQRPSSAGLGRSATAGNGPAHSS